jgi:hypothetical protein
VLEPVARHETQAVIRWLMGDARKLVIPSECGQIDRPRLDRPRLDRPRLATAMVEADAFEADVFGTSAF